MFCTVVAAIFERALSVRKALCGVICPRTGSGQERAGQRLNDEGRRRCLNPEPSARPPHTKDTQTQTSTQQCLFLRLGLGRVAPRQQQPNWRSVAICGLAQTHQDIRHGHELADVGVPVLLLLVEGCVSAIPTANHIAEQHGTARRSPAQHGAA